MTNKTDTLREEIEKMVKRWFTEPVLSVEDELVEFIETALKQQREEILEKLENMRLVDKEFLGWGRSEYRDAIDNSGDVALLTEFDTHNALVDGLLDTLKQND